VDVFYLKSFHDLSTCRVSGMGVGSIPWTAMIQYASWYGLEKDVTEAFVDIMRAMDNAFIKYQSDKTATPKPKAST